MMEQTVSRRQENVELSLLFAFQGTYSRRVALKVRALVACQCPVTGALICINAHLHVCSDPHVRRNASRLSRAHQQAATAGERRARAPGRLHRRKRMCREGAAGSGDGCCSTGGRGGSIATGWVWRVQRGTMSDRTKQMPPWSSRLSSASGLLYVVKTRWVTSAASRLSSASDLQYDELRRVGLRVRQVASGLQYEGLC